MVIHSFIHSVRSVVLTLTIMGFTLTVRAQADSSSFSGPGFNLPTPTCSKMGTSFGNWRGRGFFNVSLPLDGTVSEDGFITFKAYCAGYLSGSVYVNGFRIIDNWLNEAGWSMTTHSITFPIAAGSTYSLRGCSGAGEVYFMSINSTATPSACN